MSKSIAAIIVGLLGLALIAAAGVLLLLRPTLYEERDIAQSTTRMVTCPDVFGTGGHRPMADNSAMDDSAYYATCGLSKSNRTIAAVISGTVGLSLVSAALMVAVIPKPRPPKAPAYPYGPARPTPGAPPRQPTPPQPDR